MKLLDSIKNLQNLDQERLLQIGSIAALIGCVALLGYFSYSNLVSQKKIKGLMSQVEEVPIVSSALDTTILESKEFKNLEANGEFPLASSSYGGGNPFLK